MARTLRRLLLLALIAAAVAAWYSRRSRPGPLDLTTTSFGAETPDSGVSTPRFVESGGVAPTWVMPVGDACPAGYPVKANERSMIFHVPGGRFYERTIPERCYATADDAEADGYRRAKA